MGKIARLTREEFKRLPLMLGKVVGGIGAIVGFMVVVSTVTRVSAVPSDILLPLFVGVTGILIFVLSDSALKKGASSLIDASTIVERKRMNVLSWALLLLFVLVFLGATYLLTG